MNRINKKTEYALMALKYFIDQSQDQSKEDRGATFTAKQIAEYTHSPHEITARVLQALSTRGILKAEYGVNGGYHLVKDLKNISVFELMEVLEGSVDLAKCLASEKECDLHSKCTILNPVNELNKKIQHFYKSLSLDEVLRV